MILTAAHAPQARTHHGTFRELYAELNQEDMEHDHEVMAQSQALELTDDLQDMSRERARALADQALREAAMSEVDSWLDNKSL